MSTAVAPGRMTADEYLAWEPASPDWHEFFRGEVLELPGGGVRHNALAASVVASLGVTLRGNEQRVFSISQRIAARANEHYVYADASVVCGAFELQPGTTDVLTNPSVVVEVLSKRTEAYDRGLKWESYRTLPSVTDYLLVSQTAARIEHYQRKPNGEWLYRVAEAGDTVRLSLGAALSVDAIFAGVLELPAD